MAADPAYLIYEYKLNIKEKGMQEITEVPYDEFSGYQINIESEIFINDKKLDNGIAWKTVEKNSNNEFTIVQVVNIANIREKELNVKEKLISLYIYNSEGGYKLNVDIAQEVTAKVIFNNNDKKVLAQKELSNGSTLYIEEVANSKFENYVLARFISKPQEYRKMNSKENEFMIQNPQFAICDENGDVINYVSNSLESYYEKVLSDGSIESYESNSDIKDEDIVRIQEVQLLKLGFDDENAPEKLKILPINRKLYNDRNDSETKFYNSEDWYQVKVGDVNITEDSQIGGSITITKIEETDDKIIFYYDKNGYVPAGIDFALRVKSPQMNYRYPRLEKNKGIDGEENKIIYTKNTFMLAGLPLISYPRFDNLDDLEFALFYNVKYDILTECLEFEWNPSENEQIAKIEDIKFTEFINDINDELETEYGGGMFSGIITEINDNYLKFYSEYENKDLILSNPKNYEYANGRTDEHIDFSEIKKGDYFKTQGYGVAGYKGENIEDFTIYNKLTIVRKIEGEELREELITHLLPSDMTKNSNQFKYRKLKNIDIVSENKAIITFEFADEYQDFFEQNEKFEIKAIVNENTYICRDSLFGVIFDDNDILFSNLDTVEYVPENVRIVLDKNTLNDEMPTVTQMELGYLDTQ